MGEETAAEGSVKIKISRAVDINIWLDLSSLWPTGSVC